MTDTKVTDDALEKAQDDVWGKVDDEEDIYVDDLVSDDGDDTDDIDDSIDNKDGDDDGDKPDDNVGDDDDSKDEPDAKVVDDTPEVKEPDEPVDNKDRSKLGRKVAKLESALKDVLKQNEMLINMIKGEAKKEDDDIFAGIDDDEGVTAGQVRALMEKRTNAESAAKQKYTNDYVASLAEIEADETPKVYAKVIETMKEKFNVYRTGDGRVDAIQNYVKAKNFLITKDFDEDEIEEGAARVNPLSKNNGKEKSGLGRPGASKSKTGVSRGIKLDKFAAEFVRKTGMSKESVKRALT